MTRFKYTDQELDREAGLYNFKARLYDPAMANFISPDPYLSADLSGAHKIFTFGERRSEKRISKVEAYSRTH
jgi:RHS repeat-associated protein